MAILVTFHFNKFCFFKAYKNIHEQILHPTLEPPPYLGYIPTYETKYIEKFTQNVNTYFNILANLTAFTVVHTPQFNHIFIFHLSCPIFIQ